MNTVRRGWFYHRAEWRDVNGDGRLDIVTARAKKTLGGGARGELVWLEQPPRRRAAADATGCRLEGPWTEHLLIVGPDVHFRLVDLDGDGCEEILAAEYFKKRLAVYWRVPGVEAWRLEGRTIDDRVGSAFDVTVTDLNGDGRPDLLVTNHESDASAGVFGYEIPQEYRTATWPRHVLLTGIETTQPGFNSASPGQAVAFQPDLTRSSGKPLVPQRASPAPVAPTMFRWRCPTPRS